MSSAQRWQMQGGDIQPTKHCHSQRKYYHTHRSNHADKNQANRTSVSQKSNRQAKQPTDWPRLHTWRACSTREASATVWKCTKAKPRGAPVNLSNTSRMSFTLACCPKAICKLPSLQHNHLLMDHIEVIFVSIVCVVRCENSKQCCIPYNSLQVMCSGKSVATTTSHMDCCMQQTFEVTTNT